MDRRAFLVTAGVALAGCGSSSDDANTTTTEPTETESPTTTEAGELSVTDFSAPSSVGIGATVTLTVTVENTTSEEATYESGVSRKIQSGEWSQLDVGVEITVPAGETVTEEVEVPGYEYKAAGRHRLDEGEHVAITVFTNRTLEMGESYLAPTGVRLTVDRVEFPDSYTYDTGDGTETIQAAEGEKLAVTYLSAENTTDETVRAPGTEEVVLRRNDEEFGDMNFDSNLDKYNGGQLEAGERIEGNIPTDVPADAQLENLRVGYERSFEEGDAVANWPLA